MPRHEGDYRLPMATYIRFSLCLSVSVVKVLL